MPEKVRFPPFFEVGSSKEESSCVYALCFILGERWIGQTSVVSSKFNQSFDHCHSSCGFCTTMFRKLDLFPSLGVNMEEGSYSGRPFFKASLYHPLF